MKDILRTIDFFLWDERGATAIEYALIAGLIAVACVTALTLMGGSVTGLFDDVATKVADANASSGT